MCWYVNVSFFTPCSSMLKLSKSTRHDSLVKIYQSIVLQQKIQSSKGHGKRKSNRKTEVESEESESDPEQLTSSRTESSNQLDRKLKHSK